MKIKMTALELIHHLAGGSTTQNTLQHIAKIAKATLDAMKEREEMQPFEDMTDPAYFRGLAHGKAAAPVQEPVAWRYDLAKYRENDLRGRQWAHSVFSPTKPYIDEMVRNLTPLYTTPPAAQPAPKQYTALEQALTRLQKRYAELDAKAAAQPAPTVQEPVAWREHVEQRIRTWRQRTINKSGDMLAIDDFMGQDSIDDLVDFVCDEWVEPAAQRPFVGLTDDERNYIWHVIGNSDAHGDVDYFSGSDVMLAIEAKLRSKNNG